MLSKNVNLLSFLLFIIIMTGCGGGGGGPSTPSQPVIAQPVDDNDTSVTPPSGPVAGVDYTDPIQFNNSNAPIPLWISQIGANTAHENGFTGGNLSLHQSYTTVVSDVSNRDLQTVVAVLDSGINSTHAEFSGINKLEAWQDFSNTHSVTTIDAVGHGTLVSTLISGNRGDENDMTYGVAFDSHLIVGKVINTTGTTDNGILVNGINWVVNQKPLIDQPDQKKLVAMNLSLGTTDINFANTITRDSLKSALNSGISIVMASGNEGLDCLDAGSGLNGRCAFPAATPWIVDATEQAQFLNNTGAWIVVGSVDGSNNISSFSNKAGVTKSNYLVAPGEYLIGASNTNDNGYRVGSGTSFAAPLVTGAMALMAQKWPHLTGNQHSRILFDTATDLGAVGVDDVYGNGLINLGVAFNPVGSLTIPVGLTAIQNNSHNLNLNGTSLRTTAAMASFGDFTQLNNTIGVDNYYRDFKLDMTSFTIISGAAPYDLDAFLKFNFSNYLFGIDQQRNIPMVGYSFKKGMEISLAYDSKTMLGLESSGVLDTGKGQTTYFNVKDKILYDEELSFNFETTYAYGRSTGGGSQSLIKDISEVHALGGSVNAMYADYGIGYKIPLRVIDGNANIVAPTDIDNFGGIEYSSMNLDLKPDSFQQVFSIFYKKQIDDVYLFVDISHTIDAFGINGLASNDAKLIFNMWY